LIVTIDNFGGAFTERGSSRREDRLHNCGHASIRLYAIRRSATVAGLHGSRVVKTKTLMLLVSFSTREPYKHVVTDQHDVGR
jgi:hypothetical protein